MAALPSEFRRGFAATTAGFFLFATGPVIVAGSTVGGLAAAFWRAWIATSGMLVVALIRRNLPRETARLTMLPGLAFGVGIGLFFSAAQLTSVANTALIIVLQPLPIMVGAHFLFQEKLRRPDLAWSAMAISGAAFMVLAASSAGTSHLGGDLLAVGSTLAGSTYFLAAKRSRTKIDTVPFMVGMFAWGGVALAPMVLVAGQSLSPYPGTEWLRLVALAFLPGLGHVFINYSHGKVPLALMGIFHLLIPVVSALLAWWFLSQGITIAQVLGMAVVVFAMSAHSIYRSRLERSPVPA